MSARRMLIAVCSVALVASACGGARQWTYPPAHRGGAVDDYHGTKVADPYRWLEDAESAETTQWVAAQNQMFHQFVATPEHEAIKKRLTELWNYPKYSAPTKKGGRYFFWKNDGLQDQAVFYVQDTLDAEPRVVIDPNTLSGDGTVAVTGGRISEDGKLFAYLTSSQGSDWQQLKIRKIDSGEEYEEKLVWCKFTGVAWKHDGRGFFYDRFPDPTDRPEAEKNTDSKLYWHALGTPQSEDKLIYERPDDKELGFSPLVTEDGQYLLLYVSKGTDPKNRIYYREVESDGEFVKLLDDADAMYRPLGNVGTVLYFHTDLDAPRGRIVAIDTQSPARDQWKEIVAQRDEVVDYAALINQHLVVAYMRDAHHRLQILDLQGQVVKKIELPGMGSIYGLSGRETDSEMFYTFGSFLYPQTIFRYDFDKGESAVFRKPEVEFDPSGYETKQVFYLSKDGTRVPMFITHKKGLKQDGSHPTLLYGYGGFNISLTPYFSIVRAYWMERGGIFAVANLRGGNEYGEEWHQAGVLGNKQNVFDDFVAAGEYLIAHRYTSRDKLAINGGSNGGLLTAACLVQRPDLFGAVVSQVPVIDMLRYHKFSVGRYWVSDYGNAEKDAEHFKFLYAYSPLHNIKADTAHPPTLITTADTDDRVVPMHGKKFAAALQAVDPGANPILLRVDTKAGHGRGKPTSKRIEEYADIYAFLFKAFGMGSGE